jgi:hypothetical protein
MLKTEIKNWAHSNEILASIAHINQNVTGIASFFALRFDCG